jgi:hypothetical protein
MFDGARLVIPGPNGLNFVWRGGHGIHVCRDDGKEVGYYSVGSFAKKEATPEEVIERVNQIIQAELPGPEEQAQWL